MSIYALLTGELHRDPVQRTSSSGKVFVTANLKIQDGSETQWASLIAFDATACEELMRCHAGDSIAAQGRLKPGTYEKGGEVRVSLDITASSILPLKPKPRTRQPRQAKPDSRQFDARQAYGRPGPAHQAEDLPFDDEIPFG
ncbi:MULTISPECIES: single-stranded DNA-binding protein [unclassified Methylococcus]|uniref:single-stranded DNA-binding protein n=1 Tax=unclassified Methylococcus TaxID=2618889 RepID=UPI003D7D705B